MLAPNTPALVLAPMDGITDAPMRALQGELGGFSYAVSEFVRVSTHPLPAKVFRREVPELLNGGKTPTGLPVQAQILGGDPERMALTAISAVKAGARAIDLNFGCPAPTVNRHDGGASLLRCPARIREIVSAVRAAVPREIAVSAKLRLGWDSIASIYENTAMAAEGGASWLTIHARTRVQGYQPPVFWAPIRRVRESLGLPVVANGDIWTLDDFKRCREETGAIHFMIGRSALANPRLPRQIAYALGVGGEPEDLAVEWQSLFRGLIRWTDHYTGKVTPRCLLRLKGWANLAAKHGDFERFDEVKRATTLDEFFAGLTGEPDRDHGSTFASRIR